MMMRMACAQLAFYGALKPNVELLPVVCQRRFGECGCGWKEGLTLRDVSCVSDRNGCHITHYCR